MASRGVPVVLLSGATGSVGAPVARAVLAAGGKVAAAVRRPWQVDKLRAELAGGSSLLVGVVGPRDAEAAAGFVKGANDALGPITAFVGAAGCLRRHTPGKEPAGDLEEMLDANLWANATLARAALPTLRRRGAGLLAFVGAPGDPGQLSVTCRASKAALREYVAALELDVGPSGLRCACIAETAGAAVPGDELAAALAALALEA